MRKPHRRCLFGLVCVFILSGCAHYRLVSAGQVLTVGGAFSVSPRIDWSMSDRNHPVTWTVDGPALQKLQFFPGIENGKPLIELPAAADRPMPSFKAKMTPIEIWDLIEATLSRMSAHEIKNERVQPAPFGSLEGFRFFFSFVSAAGLDYRGLAAGAVKDQKLFLVMYTGTKRFYYDKCLKEVERIIDSIKIHAQLRSQKSSPAPRPPPTSGNRQQIIRQARGCLAQIQAEQTGQPFQDADADLRIAFQDRIESFLGQGDISRPGMGPDRGRAGKPVNDGHLANRTPLRQGSDDDTPLGGGFLDDIHHAIHNKTDVIPPVAFLK